MTGQPPPGTQVLLGTYTERLSHADGRATGILSAAFSDGVLGVPEVRARVRNPSWLAVSESGGHVYAVNETTDFGGRDTGGISAFARDQVTGSLTSLPARPSAGLRPAHLAIHPNGRFVIAANYGSGSVGVWRIDGDGSLAELTDCHQHVGSSIDPVRQSAPHPHMIGIDPETGDVLVPDLGLDAVVVYKLDDSGRLHERSWSPVRVRAGAGPRHLAFHPVGSVLFLLSELDNTLSVLHREPAGLTTGTKCVSSLPAGFSGPSKAGAVRVSQSGSSVYVSNRGHDSVAIFHYDIAADTLQLAAVEPSGGEHPRDISLSPDSRYLLVANQDTHNVVTFQVNSNSALEPVSQTYVPSPVCIVFVRGSES